MKKMILFCFLCLFIFNFTVYSQQQELPNEIKTPEGYIFYNYQYAYLDISLIYPEKWMNYSSQERGVLIDTPDSKGSIMILGTPLFGEDYTLEKLWAENRECLELAGAIFQEPVSDTFSGYPAIKGLHTIKIGNSNHQYLRYSAIIDDLFYTFSFHAPVAEFEKYLEEVLFVAHSVVIKLVE